MQPNGVGYGHADFVLGRFAGRMRSIAQLLRKARQPLRPGLNKR